MKKYIFLLMTTLLMTVFGSSPAWGQTDLSSNSFSEDFTTWTTAEATTAGANTLNGKTNIVFYNNDNTKHFVVTNGTGLTFPSNNLANKYFMAIPLTGINGEITITFKHEYNSSKAKFNYVLKPGTTTYSSNDVSSGTSVTDTNSSDTECSATISVNEETAVLYIGRASSSFTTLKGLTITTPASGQLQLSAAQNYTWNFSSNITQEASANSTILANGTYNFQINNSAIASHNSTETSGLGTTDKHVFFDGTGNTSNKFVRVKVQGPCKITVFGQSTSTDTRNLVINCGGNSTEVPVTNEVSSGSYFYTGSSSQDVYIYSANSGIYLYGIKVEPTLSQFEFNPDDIYYYKDSNGEYINSTTFERNTNYDYLRLKLKITPDFNSLGNNKSFSVTSDNSSVLNVTDQTPAFWKSSDNRMYVNNIKVAGSGTATLTFTYNGSDDYAGPLSFTQTFTVTEPTAPTLSLSTPATTTNVPVNTSIVLTANRTVSAVGETISGTLNGEAVTFTLTNGNTLTYTPASNLANGTNYTVVLNAEQVKGTNGISNAATTFTFTTVENVATITAVMDKVWNFSDWSTGNYSTTTVVESENIEIITASVMSVSSSNKTFTDTDATTTTNLGTLSFSNRLATGGTSSASNRLIHFKVKKGSTIQVVAASQSNNDSRFLYLCKDNYNTSNPVASFSADGTLTKLTYTYNTDDAATEADFYIGTGGGMAIYYIKVSSNRTLVTMRPGGSQAGTSEGTAKSTNQTFSFYIVPNVTGGSITDLFGSTGGTINSDNFTITSSNSDIVNVGSVSYSASTDDLGKGRFLINGLKTGAVGGHADITLKYLGNDNYSEATTTFTIYVKGPQPFQISASNLSVQNSQKAYIMPTITNNNGDAIGFEGTDVIVLNDDVTIDYEEYFDFSYSLASNDAGLTLDASDNSIVVSARGEEYVGKSADVTITATPKSAYASHFTNGSATKTITVTVIERSSGNYISFFLDKAKTTQVTDVYSYEMDGSTSVFPDFPNGRIIYVDFNYENLNKDEKSADEIWFSYNVGSSVKLTPSSSGRTDYSKKQYLLNINRGGMVPIHIDDAPSGDVYVNFQCFKKDGDNYTSVGSIIPVKFQVVDHSRPANVTYDPESDGTLERNTAQNVVAIGTSGNSPKNEVYAKFSSTGTKYTIEGLVNEPNVIFDLERAGVFSTEVAGRKISGVQIQDYSGEPFVSKMTTMSYVYLFATTLNLSQNEYHIDLPTEGSVDFTEPTVTASYYDKVQKKQIDASSGDGITISYSVQNFNGANVSVDSSTGAVTLGSNSGQAIVTVTYRNTNNITVNKRTSTMEVATATYTIYLTKSGEHLPKISPASKKFYPTIEVTVTADSQWATYYTTNGNTPTTSDTKIEAGSSETFTVSATTTVKAVAHDGSSTYTQVISETYTLGEQVLPPTFVPDGVTSTYTYYTETLGVEARASTAGSSVYYTIGQGSLPADPVIGNAGTYRYDGLQGITLTDGGTTYIKAIAYKEGIQSTVVTATYQFANMDAPYFIVNGGQHTSGSVPVNTNDAITIGSDANAGDNTLIHYYTLDGSEPTPENGIRFTSAFNVVKTVTGKAMSVLVDALGNILSSSATTTVTFTVSGASNVWEANSITTPNGKLLSDDGLVISTNRELIVGNSGSNVNQNSLPKGDQPITFAQAYITATFGGFDLGSWAHFTINDEAIGTPIDGVGEYNIKNNPQLDNDSGEDAKDESGYMYSHINTGLSETYDGTYYTGVSTSIASPNPTSTHEKTFKLPSRGTYVKFEPEKDGDLTIWALQQGGIHYKNDSKLCDRFVRRRPVYFIDEQGNSIQATEAISSARLSAHWNTIINGYAAEGKNWFTALESSQDGAPNNFYNNEESEALYNMFLDYFLKRGDYADASKYGSNTISVGDPIQPIPIHTPSRATNPITERGGHNSDNSTDMTGYVLASGGYVKYTFPVKAGKTYYFFGHATKVGIRGFRFTPTETAERPAISLADAGTAYVVNNENKPLAELATAYAGKPVKFTLNRQFYNGKWAGLVLPFSVSATQLEKVFGKGTSVIHFNGIREEGGKYYLKLRKHFHQMLVAGTPVFIKPTKDIAANEGAVFDGVHLENLQKIDEMKDSYYTTKGTFLNATNAMQKYDYYIAASTGNFKRLISDSSNAKATRVWVSPNDKSNAPALEFGSFDDDEATSIIGIEIEDLTTGETYYYSKGVYDLNGRKVSEGSLEGLPSGVYIVNGKKTVVK